MPDWIGDRTAGVRPEATRVFGRNARMLFSNGSRREALLAFALSGACVLCVLVRHLMG